MSKQHLSKFPCNSCGLCCRLISHNPETQYLDRGDGTCKYLNEQNNLCSIYEDRPLVCRVQDYYLEHLQDNLSWEKFVEINLNICLKLQEK